MNTARWHPPAQSSGYAQGFALSVLLHGSAIGLAVVLLSDLRLATQPDAFHWQVSVVATTHQPALQEMSAASAEPPIAQPAPVAPSVAEQNGPPTTASVPPVRSESAVTMPSRPDATPHRAPPPTAPRTDPVDTTSSPPPSTPTEDTARASPNKPSPANERAPRAFPEAPFEPPMDARGPVDVPPPPRAMMPPLAPESGSNTTSTSPASAAQPPAQTATMPLATLGKPDFSWLTNSLRNIVKESQQYSTVARLNGLEGRVVLRITVKENGELAVSVATSSGHEVLDQDAVNQVTRLSPLPLPQPLGRAQQVLNLPIIYSLNQ